MPERREVARTVDNASKQRRFRQADAPDVFAEVRLCTFAEAANIERSALSHVHLVHIKLKDLLLREALLQLKRDHDLGSLAAHVALVIQEEAARHLHRQRRATLHAMAPEQRDQNAFRKPDVID